MQIFAKREKTDYASLDKAQLIALLKEKDEAIQRASIKARAHRRAIRELQRKFEWVYKGMHDNDPGYFIRWEKCKPA